MLDLVGKYLSHDKFSQATSKIAARKANSNRHTVNRHAGDRYCGPRRGGCEARSLHPITNGSMGFQRWEPSRVCIQTNGTDEQPQSVSQARDFQQILYTSEHEKYIPHLLKMPSHSVIYGCQWQDMWHWVTVTAEPWRKPESFPHLRAETQGALIRPPTISAGSRCSAPAQLNPEKTAPRKSLLSCTAQITQINAAEALLAPATLVWAKLWDIIINNMLWQKINPKITEWYCDIQQALENLFFPITLRQ